MSAYSMIFSPQAQLVKKSSLQSGLPLANQTTQKKQGCICVQNVGKKIDGSSYGNAKTKHAQYHIKELPCIGTSLAWRKQVAIAAGAAGCRMVWKRKRTPTIETLQVDHRIPEYLQYIYTVYIKNNCCMNF